MLFMVTVMIDHRSQLIIPYDHLQQPNQKQFTRKPKLFKTKIQEGSPTKRLAKVMTPYILCGTQHRDLEVRQLSNEVGEIDSWGCPIVGHVGCHDCRSRDKGEGLHDKEEGHCKEEVGKEGVGKEEVGKEEVVKEEEEKEEVVVAVVLELDKLDSLGKMQHTLEQNVVLAAMVYNSLCHQIYHQKEASSSWVPLQ